MRVMLESKVWPPKHCPADERHRIEERIRGPYCANCRMYIHPRKGQPVVEEPETKLPPLSAFMRP